jgi:hypothetical protein
MPLVLRIIPVIKRSSAGTIPETSGKLINEQNS